MMLKNLQESLISICKDKKTVEVFDILLYGSIVKGKFKPRDIDVVVIFYNKPLNERLEHIQKIKFEIKEKLDVEVDIKSMDLQDFLKKEEMARAGIILEGVSLIDGINVSEKFGFKGFTIFTYTLKGLTHTEKVKFNYTLNGRISQGILKQLNGISLGKGAVKIPIQNSLEFEDFLVNKKIGFKKSNMLEEL